MKSRVNLTPREAETLKWVASGKTDWEIGKIMGMSEHGANYYIRALMEKFGTSSRVVVVVEAMRQGLVE